jgi:hypothetical protein
MPKVIFDISMSLDGFMTASNIRPEDPAARGERGGRRAPPGPSECIGACMRIADRAVLVTGANRRIGQALVEEVLRRGAKRVYAGMRTPWPTRMGASRP